MMDERGGLKKVEVEKMEINKARWINTDSGLGVVEAKYCSRTLVYTFIPLGTDRISGNLSKTQETNTHIQ